MYANPRLAGILNHFSEAQYLLKPCVNLPENKPLYQCTAPGGGRCNTTQPLMSESRLVLLTSDFKTVWPHEIDTV